MLEWLFSAGESNLWLFLGIMIIGLGTELIPAEVGLPLLGLYVSNGTISWTIAVLVGFLGSLMGATVFYLLGRYAGRPILVRYGKWLLIKEKEIEQGERIVGKYGTWSALFGRFFPVVRSVVSIPCGLFGLSFKRYLLASSIGLFPVSFFYICHPYLIKKDSSHATPTGKGVKRRVLLFLSKPGIQAGGNKNRFSDLIRCLGVSSNS